LEKVGPGYEFNRMKQHPRWHYYKHLRMAVKAIEQLETMETK